MSDSENTPHKASAKVAQAITEMLNTLEAAQYRPFTEASRRWKARIEVLALLEERCDVDELLQRLQVKVWNGEAVLKDEGEGLKDEREVG